MKRTVIVCIAFGCVMTAMQVGNYVLAAAVAAVWLFYAFGRRASIRGHTHTGQFARVALHEGGHIAAIRQAGGRVTSSWVSGNTQRANGYTLGVMSNDPAARIGFHLAGVAAAPDTSANSPEDMRMVDKELSKVPSHRRREVLKEGRRRAAKAGGSSDARSYAKILERKGRL